MGVWLTGKVNILLLIYFYQLHLTCWKPLRVWINWSLSIAAPAFPSSSRKWHLVGLTERGCSPGRGLWGDAMSAVTTQKPTSGTADLNRYQRLDHLGRASTVLTPLFACPLCLKGTCELRMNVNFLRFCFQLCMYIRGSSRNPKSWTAVTSSSEPPSLRAENWTRSKRSTNS